MLECRREHPEFALCGLNCCLCPRFHTEGSSRCPGCGGHEFAEKHPTCAVISCAKRHGDFQFCHQCPDFPCPKYASNDADSFISYRNVTADLAFAKEHGTEAYLERLRAKSDFLLWLLATHNDGRRKNFYCLVANLIPAESIPELRRRIDAITPDPAGNPPGVTSAKEVENLIREFCREIGIVPELRRPAGKA